MVLPKLVINVPHIGTVGHLRAPATSRAPTRDPAGLGLTRDGAPKAGACAPPSSGDDNDDNSLRGWVTPPPTMMVIFDLEQLPPHEIQDS